MRSGCCQRVLFDYIDGDAEDGSTRRANRAGYERLTLRQQVPTTVAKADLGVEVLGRTLSMPIIVAPCGLAAMVHPDGPIGANRAAAGRGTISVLSTVAGTSPAELAAEVDDPGWFQLYAPGGRDGCRAAHPGGAGPGLLGAGRHDRHRGAGPARTRLGARHLDAVAPVPRVAAGLAVQVAARPVWLGRLLKDQVARRRAVGSGASTRAASKPAVPGMGASPFTWEDIAWIRSLWDGPLIVKGLVTADDARRARDVGVQAVVVSNHGGRQLDGAPATIDALPAVVDAVGEDLEVLVDGGIRRGTDVIKALSMGARAVQIGRPWLFGLAVAGQPGVEHVLRLLRRELRNALSLMDVTAVRDLDRSHLL